MESGNLILTKFDSRMVVTSKTITTIKEAIVCDMTVSVGVKLIFSCTRRSYKNR